MRYIRVLIVALAAALALAFASPVLAQWPTACVDLNDIVEDHLGNHGNVGIYQRTFDNGAEAACQSDHRDDVRAVFAWAFDGESAGPIAPTPWPSTCVALNDIVEAHLGNTGNVQIYQRTFGSGPAAESACQTRPPRRRPQPLRLGLWRPAARHPLDRRRCRQPSYLRHPHQRHHRLLGSQRRERSFAPAWRVHFRSRRRQLQLRPPPRRHRRLLGLQRRPHYPAGIDASAGQVVPRHSRLMRRFSRCGAGSRRLTGTLVSLAAAPRSPPHREKSARRLRRPALTPPSRSRSAPDPRRLSPHRTSDTGRPAAQSRKAPTPCRNPTGRPGPAAALATWSTRSRRLRPR